MKKKYFELSTENIKEYTNKCRDILSYYIQRKRGYLQDIDCYDAKLCVTNANIRIILHEINELIIEIRELSKRIASLEKGRVSLAYSYNTTNFNGDTDKVNNARYYYSEIILELNSLISYRDELKSKLVDYKNRKNMLVDEKNEYSNVLNKYNHNISICTHNMNVCYKILNKLDNIYFSKIDRVSENYIKLKLKRIK